MRWWGWGDQEHAITLPPAALALLGQEPRTTPQGNGRVELDAIALPDRICPPAPGVRSSSNT